MQTFTVYEYATLRIGEPCEAQKDGPVFTNAHFKTLDDVAKQGGDIYYQMRNRQVRFGGKVGLLHFGTFQIEVLPKADALPEAADARVWRRRLFAMMRRAGYFSADHVPDAQARQSDTMLDLLLGQYLAELEQYLQRGLIKRYVEREGNLPALRGRLLFSKQIQQNLVHAERFYTAHTRYERDHALNQVLWAALAAVPKLAVSIGIASAARRLLLSFPEVTPPARPLELLARLRHDRKSEPYRSVLRLARYILEGLHPDTRSGPRLVFSLMLDMDRLWEAWLRAELRQIWHNKNVTVGRSRSVFYRGEDYAVAAESDITLTRAGESEPFAILDAKWKLPPNNRPNEHDLRQVFAYQHRFGGKISALVYPGAHRIAPGAYWSGDRHCHLVWITVEGHGWAQPLWDMLSPPIPKASS